MISNKTRNKTLAKRSAIMRSTLQKGIGLMFRTSAEPALIFPYQAAQRISIHMLFVFTPIDIIFLDKKKRVVELAANIMPFTFYTSHKKATTFIELPPGTIKTSGTRIGDLLRYP